MEIKKAKLYIIPSFIGSNESIEHIPKYNLKIINKMKIVSGKDVLIYKNLSILNRGVNVNFVDPNFFSSY